MTALIQGTSETRHVDKLPALVGPLPLVSTWSNALHQLVAWKQLHYFLSASVFTFNYVCSQYPGVTYNLQRMWPAGQVRTGVNLTQFTPMFLSWPCTLCSIWVYLIILTLIVIFSVLYYPIPWLVIRFCVFFALYILERVVPRKAISTYPRASLSNVIRVMIT